MDLEAMIDAKMLKHAVAVLRRVGAEAVVEVNGTGIECRLVDDANAQITQVVLPSDVFDLFSVGSARRLGVNLTKVHKVLQRATMKDSTHITGAEDALYFTRGMHQKSVKLVDAVEIRKPPQIPELSLTATISLSGREFKEIVAEAEDVGEALHITVTPHEIVFEASWDPREAYRGVLDAGRLVLRSGVKSAHAVYTLTWLRNITTDMKSADEVMWQFATDMPCDIQYSRDGVSVRHILAPRIESV